MDKVVNEVPREGGRKEGRMDEAEDGRGRGRTATRLLARQKTRRRRRRMRRRKKDFESFDVTSFSEIRSHLSLPLSLSLYISRTRTHSPVVVLEARPPVWRLEQSLERAREVHEPVAHQEEHG